MNKSWQLKRMLLTSFTDKSVMQIKKKVPIQEEGNECVGNYLKPHSWGLVGSRVTANNSAMSTAKVKILNHVP